VEGGKWKVESKKWKVESGKWKVERTRIKGGSVKQPANKPLNIEMWG
jgi:hypothetical protein